MKPMDIETAMSRLEELTRLLESGELTLEQSIKAFEEGCALAGQCNKLLDEAQLRIETLTAPKGAEAADAK